MHYIVTNTKSSNSDYIYDMMHYIVTNIKSSNSDYIYDMSSNDFALLDLKYSCTPPIDQVLCATYSVQDIFMKRNGTFKYNTTSFC